jgi:hypothetical protein
MDTREIIKIAVEEHDGTEGSAGIEETLARHVEERLKDIEFVSSSTKAPTNFRSQITMFHPSSFH